jgi:hypothetical protein
MIYCSSLWARNWLVSGHAVAAVRMQTATSHLLAYRERQSGAVSIRAAGVRGNKTFSKLSLSKTNCYRKNTERELANSRSKKRKGLASLSNKD